MATSGADLKALMIESLNGGAAAHGLLVRVLVPLLRSLYRRRLAVTEDVDDFVQDTVIIVRTRRQTDNRDRPFTAWLYAIARYRVIDHYRRRRQTMAIEDVESILIVESFEDAANARIDVDSLLKTLSPKQARAIRDTQVEARASRRRPPPLASENRT